MEVRGLERRSCARLDTHSLVLMHDESQSFAEFPRLPQCLAFILSPEARTESFEPSLEELKEEYYNVRAAAMANAKIRRLAVHFSVRTFILVLNVLWSYRYSYIQSKLTRAGLGQLVEAVNRLLK